jgi:hypothetical protein
MTKKTRIPITTSTGVAVPEAAAPAKIMDRKEVKKSLRNIVDLPFGYQ